MTLLHWTDPQIHLIKLRLPLPNLNGHQTLIGQSAPIFELLSSILDQSEAFGMPKTSQAPALSLSELIARTSPPSDEELSPCNGLKMMGKPKTPLTILLESIMEPGEERPAEDPVHR